MGLTGAKGKVYYVDDSCPVTGWTAPSGTEVALADDVTKFDVEDSVQKREYGHDKSGAWQDVVAGTRRLQITLDAVINAVTAVGGGANRTLYAGRVLFLVLYPFGATGTCAADPIQGYAMVERVSHTHDLETGKPVAYTATVVSKGPWGGLDDGSAWGGFECSCT